MKIIELITASVILSNANAEIFNTENVKNLHGQIYESLNTDSLAIQWKDATTDEIKSEKFSQLLSKIGNPPLGRHWTYPGLPNWPLLNWDKVDKLEKLIEDQFDFSDQVGVLAQNDEEFAKIITVSWVAKNAGRDMEPWYEKWLLELAKSQDVNLKRLNFCSIRNFAEDIGKDNSEDGTRAIDWNQWGQAFNQSDRLGKALLLVCMHDLALRKEEYGKVTELHLGIFNGTDDDLKAIALYASSKLLGPEVVAKWQDLADHHPNPKMKALAQEALAR